MKNIQTQVGFVLGAAVSATILTELSSRVYSKFLSEKYGKINRSENFLIYTAGAGALLGAGLLYTTKCFVNSVIPPLN